MPKADNVKYFREKMKMSQQDYADFLGVSRATISSWETKRHSIPRKASEHIAKKLGITYHDFCSEDMRAIETANDKPLKLSAIERQNIALFRELPDDIKHAIRQMIIHSHKLMKGEKG